MRWALVGPLHPFRGGIAHYGASLARQLADVDDDEVHAVNFRRLYPRLLFPGSSQFDESESPIAFDAPRMLGGLDPFSWEKCASHIAAHAPDAALFHWWHPFFGPAYGSLARRLKRKSPSTKIIFLCHNVLPHERSVVDRLFAGYALGAADACLLHSESDAATLVGMRPGLCRAVYPHPRYEAFRRDVPGRAEARERLGVGRGEPMALFFGYVRAYKGLDLALAGLARSGRADLRLWVVGEFYEDRGPYDRQIRELGLRDRVTMVNRYVANEEVPDYFQAADLVLQPYHSATQSGIAQIAAAFGRPVLATRVGGLPEQIDDGVTGLLIPPGDSDALGAALDRFFDEDLGPKMEAAIVAASDRFSWAGLARSLRDLAAECGP